MVCKQAADDGDDELAVDGVDGHGGVDDALRIVEVGLLLFHHAVHGAAAGPGAIEETAVDVGVILGRIYGAAGVIGICCGGEGGEEEG